VLPGLVLDTTEPDHLSVRETGEMADPRTASATVKFRDKEFGLGVLQPSTIWAGARTALKAGAGLTSLDGASYR
jgi:hypothetical protein